MGRPSTVEMHKDRDAIVSELAAGKPLAEISRRYGLSKDALSRFRFSRNIELQDGIEDDPYSPATVVERMRALVEDARQLRVLAGYTSPGIRSRLIDSEARLLGQFRELLGVDAVAVSDGLAAGQALARAVARFVRDDPRSAQALVSQLQTDETLADLGNALAARMTTTTEEKAS